MVIHGASDLLVDVFGEAGCRRPHSSFGGRAVQGNRGVGKCKAFAFNPLAQPKQHCLSEGRRNESFDGGRFSCKGNQSKYICGRKIGSGLEMTHFPLILACC